MNSILPNILPMYLTLEKNDIIKLFKNHSDLFINYNLILDALHFLGWSILKGLVWLEEVCRSLVDMALNLTTFMNSTGFNDFYKQMKPFAFAIFAIALGYLAYTFLLAHEKPKGLLVNFALLAITMVALPWGMSALNDITLNATKLIRGEGNTSTGWEIARQYTTDLYYLDSKDFSEKSINTVKNGYTVENSNELKYININQVMDVKEDEELKKAKNKDVFNKYLGKNEKGEYDLFKFKKKWFGATEYYYRYKVNYLQAILVLLVLVVVYLLSSYKIVQIILELAFEKIIAPFFATGDITNGQKIKKILSSIINGYITLVIIIALQRIFFLWVEFLNQTQFNENGIVNGLIQAIFMLFGALLVIDAPNICEQILGIDAGLKSAMSVLQSAYYASQTLSSIGKGISGGIGKAVGGVGKAVGGVGGIMANGGSALAGGLSGLNEALGGMSTDMQSQGSSQGLQGTKADSQASQQNANASVSSAGEISSAGEATTGMMAQASGGSGGGETGSINERAGMAGSTGGSNMTNSVNSVNANSTTSVDANNSSYQSDGNNLNSAMPNASESPQQIQNQSVSQANQGGISEYVANHIQTNTKVGQSYTKGKEVGKMVGNSIKRGKL